MESQSVHKLFSKEEFQANSKDIHKFHDELRSKGYVYIESTPEIDETMKQLIVISRRFFSLPFDVKNNFTLPSKANQTNWMRMLSCVCGPPERINNYSGKFVKKDLNPREYYDVRYDCINLIDKDFEQHANEGFELFNELARRYLDQIMYPLDIDESYLSDITTSGSDNLTGIKMVRYTYNGDTDKETCLRHTDRGLITISYCLESGLTAKDFHSHQWSDIEAAAPQRPCLLLFTGEALSRLTGGYFKAVLHKVVSKTDRYSFPFFYRARFPALLDMHLLRSPVLEELLGRGLLEAYPPISVKDLDSITQIQYHDRTMPLELGAFKSDSYWALNDNEDDEGGGDTEQACRREDSKEAKEPN